MKTLEEYHATVVPGEFDHRGGDCEIHGVNIPVFRAKGTLGPYFCVQCSLAVLETEHGPSVTGED